MNCVQPIPNCADRQVIQDSYLNLNKTAIECWEDREMYIAGRVYLGVAIFNGACIILTTGLFIYFASGTTTATNPSLRLGAKRLQQIWKKHSIQQRSVMGTTLGAIGHLIFSSFMLLAQALNATIGCELVLWGICIGFYTWMFAFCTRAHRLKFMFRLNQLKVKYLRMPSADRLLCIDDKDYRWYLSHKRNVRKSLMKPYTLYIVTIAIIIAIGVPVEKHTIATVGQCQIIRGSALLIAFFGFFIVVLVPFILWYLKDNADAHGIRQELWINAVIGVPIFIIYLLFFFVLQPETLSDPEHLRRPFRPGNWVVILTAIAHFMSVVIPVLGYLPIQNKYWIKFRNYISRKFSLRKRKSLAGSGTAMTKINSDTNASIDPSTSTSIGIPEVIIPELSVESLERSMLDPEMMHQLQDLAIRDFSSENLLFYEKFLELESKFKQEIARTDLSNSGNVSMNWLQSYIMKKPSSTSAATTATGSPMLKNDTVITVTEINQQQKVQKFLSIPIPYKMYPSFVKFYETFIAENTSSQVNISYRARHSIDLAFENIYQKFPELNPKIEGSSSNRSIITTLTSRISTDDPFEKFMGKDKNQQINKEEEYFEPILTMGTFETARIEVCWNIFNSVYPKFVEMYNNNSINNIAINNSSS